MNYSTQEGLSQTTEKVDWEPIESDPNIMDSGEQPGWTKSVGDCNNQINDIDDAKSCLDTDTLDKKFIVVKHEQKEENQPILSKEPTIEPYKIEVYGNNNYAVDWQGNIYHYQTWA